MIKVLKDKKFLIFLGIVCVVAAVLSGWLVGSGPKRHNESLKKNIQKIATPIAEECGLANLEVVYVDDGSYEKVVMACENMSEISYDKKTKFFDDVAAAMDKAGSKYSFYGTDKVAVYSGGNRYTASVDTLTKEIYENGTKIDPTTNKVSVAADLYVKIESASSSSSSNKSSSSSSSSSSNSSSSKKTCKGGVSCRAGYHPCHPMSNGYCNQCCHD